MKKNKGITLEDVLKESKKETQRSAKLARKYLADLENSIKDATDEINQCYTSLDRYNINDESIKKTIKEQLTIIQNEFKHGYSSTERDLLEKERETSDFIITLFGRTMTGKSTLMEILTHGNGASIGNGGQRTTRDVRSYKWKGMIVTDVPGIEAYGGEDDDSIAEGVAIYADMILFLITSGQPTNEEADWLVKLKRKDKPIVCICNYLKSIPDERIERFINKKDKIKSEMNIDGIKEQFNSFIQSKLPNEKIEILSCHLLSKFKSQQPEYKNYKKELEEFSNFKQVENEIIRVVKRNGILYRKKCFLSIIDAPIYFQMNKLFDFSDMAKSNYDIIHDKIIAYRAWKNNNNEDIWSTIESKIECIFENLYRSVGWFVEENIENQNINNEWEKFVARQKIKEKVTNYMESIHKRNIDKVNEIFEDLQYEIKHTNNFSENNVSLNTYDSIDWKRMLKWTSLIGAAGAGILGVLGVITGPIGWAIGGISFAIGIIASFFESKEKKLKKARENMELRLVKNVDYMKRHTIKNVKDWYGDNILRGIQKNTEDKLSMFERSMLTLANVERNLALRYNQNHLSINMQMIKDIFEAVEAIDYIKHLDIVARIPGKICVICFSNMKLKIPYYLTMKIQEKLGNNEEVRFISIRKKDKKSLTYYLIEKFNIEADFRMRYINNNKDQLLEVRKKNNTNFSNLELDYINIIRQILNIHIIIK